MTPADDAVERPDTEGAAWRRLRELQDDGVVITRAEYRALLAERDSLLARVRELERRLEIDRVWVLKPNLTDAEMDGPIENAMVEKIIPPEERDHQIDGIEARDETIKLQDEERDRLSALNARLVAMLRWSLARIQRADPEFTRSPDYAAAAVLAEAKKEMTPDG